MTNDKSYTILVVDDQVSNLRIIIKLLDENANYNLLQAVDGRTACQIAFKKRPDLIILDWFMPEMDGIRVVHALKRFKETQDIPIIIATAVMLTSHHLQEALEAGAIDFLRKPIDKVELLARVKSILLLSDYQKTIIEQNEDLQHHKEELEAINAKLVTANEEYQITNEVLNITNKKLQTAYYQLSESEKRYRQLANSTFEALVFHDGKVILDANTKFLELVDQKRDEIIDKPFWHFIPKKFHHIVKQSAISTKQENYEIVLQNTKGETIDAEILSRPIPFHDIDARVVAIRDISIRKEAERLEKLRMEEKVLAEQKINNLQKEKFEADISYKNRQLSSSTLHLINKSRVLSKIKKAFDEIVNDVEKKDKQKFETIRQLINENTQLDKDWEDFKMHFEEVHPDFFSRIQEKFTGLSSTDIKHCAYIKIGLSTKEIARLFNISHRSVQVSRYRMKKKMNLPEETDMIEYIVGF